MNRKNPIATVTGRASLPVTKNPTWQSVAPGVQLGLAITPRTMAWRGRMSDPTDRSKRIAMPTAEPLLVEPAQGGLSYADAVQRVLAWAATVEADHVAMAQRIRRRRAGDVSVADCCASWLAHKAATAGDRVSPKTVEGWQGRADMVRRVLGADRPLDELTAGDLDALRDRPLDDRRRGDGSASGKPRSKATGDRDLGQAKAILTAGARRLGYAGPTGWQVAGKHGSAATALERADKLDASVDEEVGRVFTLDEIRALVLAAESFDPPFATFLRTMTLTCQRPQALRMADVGDLDDEARTLRLRYGKNALKRRRRDRDRVLRIPLFADAFDLLVELARGRPNSAPLLAGADGDRLPQAFQRYPMRKAVQLAGIAPEGATVYAVRRGAISWAATAGGIDVLTLSAMADADPVILARHYFRRTERLGRGPDLAPRLRVVTSAG